MRNLLLLISAMIWLSGCIAPEARISTVYNFGASTSSLDRSVIKRQSSRRVTSIQVANVVSPLWLDNPAIHYRFAYSNPAKLYTYANSRWITSPTTLLTQKIRGFVSTDTPYFVIKNNAQARADYILQVELEEFIQVFDHVDSSYVVVSLRASLIDRRSRLLLSQQRFSDQLPTPTADAAGAVSAFSIVSQQLTHQIVKWIHEEQIAGS